MNKIGKTHFTWHEALSGSGYRTVPLLMRRNVLRHAKNLDRLRETVNLHRRMHLMPPTGIDIISWIRSPEKNKAVHGASNSRHLKGDATDISSQEIHRLCPWRLGERDFDRIAAQVFAKGGFGIYPGGNRHVDSRGWFARWSDWIKT